jgi:hypothetical protein
MLKTDWERIIFISSESALQIPAALRVDGGVVRSIV